MKQFRYFESYDEYCGTDIFIVGATADIKALFKSIDRNKRTELCPLFEGFPKFSPAKNMYALRIDEAGYVTVVNSDTMLSILMECDVVELPQFC